MVRADVLLAAEAHSLLAEGYDMRLVGVTVAVGTALLALTACGWEVTTKQFTDDATVEQRVTSVRVANDSGGVTIRTGDQTTVRRTVHHDDARPEATHRVEGDALVLDRCPVRRCWIDYEVTVPAGTRVLGQIDSGNVELDGVASVNIKASSGKVTVRKVPGTVTVAAESGSVSVSDVGDAVTVRASSGSVRVDNVRAALTVHAESGTIHARGVGGAADVESDSGTVTVQLAEAQNVRAHADSGAVNVTVPRAAYRLKTTTDSGEVSGDVADDASGTHQLDLSSDSGDIVVRYA
jgi:putative adhesin